MTLALRPLGAQTITSFTPTAGAPGDLITLIGSGFTSGVFIYFWNGKQASVQFISSDSSMTVYVPANTTTGPIGIQGPGGSAYTADDFLAVGPGPYISGFSPGYGATNDLVSISGVHFAGTAPKGVSFNGVASSDAVVSADGTSIDVHVPYGATNGLLRVASATGTTNSPTAFTVVGPGPFITGFSPAMGTAGQQVFISGMHFTGATGATFNGVAGAGFAVRSDTQVQVNAPGGVTTGPIAVNSPLGNFVTSSNFFVPPAITSFTPANGRAGTEITISGSNFLGATAVRFNGTASSNYTVLNNNSIHAAVPGGATTGLIRVSTPSFSTFSTNNFVVQPSIFGFSPSFGAVGLRVTITGANFNAANLAVSFNGTPVPSGSISGITFGQLTALVPAGATTGPITVSTIDGSSTSSSNFFLPAIVSVFSPTNGPLGTRIKITGQNFIGATAVSFNGAAAAFTVTNNTTAGATVPAGVTTGPISITTPAGSAASANLFYVPPIISGFNPTHGLPGTLVTINGTNFLGATAVRFSGVSGKINSVNNGQIVAVVPGGAQTGPITVEAPGGANSSAADFVLDYTSDLRLSITDAPDPVPMGSNLVYTLIVVNQGPYDAPNVQLTNTLPAGAELNSATTSQGSVSTTGNPILASLGAIPNGGAATVTLSISPPVAETLVDGGSVGSDYTDPVPANNIATITTSVMPLLSVSVATNQLVRLSWPTNFIHFVLQSESGVAAGYFWSNVVSLPVVSNSLEVVTETNLASSRFYRLRR